MERHGLSGAWRLAPRRWVQGTAGNGGPLLVHGEGEKEGYPPWWLLLTFPLTHSLSLLLLLLQTLAAATASSLMFSSRRS
jgi:hypothetical protein